MNQILPIKMTVDEFLAWSQRQERGRYELEDGRVIEMQAQNLQHVELKQRMFDMLRKATNAAGLPFYAMPDGPTVRIDDRRAYEPDALVAPLPKPDRTSLEINNPIIVVEVLSPTSARRDLIVKARSYAYVATIEHYLVVDPEDQQVLHYRRHGDRLIPPLDPSEGLLHLDPPGIELDIGHLFPPTERAGSR